VVAADDLVGAEVDLDVRSRRVLERLLHDLQRAGVEVVGPA
jgi:hypothetical protein